MERWDAVVVGAGAMGSATARALAERGRSTLVLERFRVGHARGSSHGATRIFRLAYHHPDYVRMARLALEQWRELESRSGRSLLRQTGGLDLGPGAAVAADAVSEAGVGFEWLSPEAVAERWSGVRLDVGTKALFQADAGVCRATETVAAQAELALRAGAELREETIVTGLAPAGDRVEVRTAEGGHRAAVAVLTAGAWVPRLAPMKLAVTRELVTYFGRDPAPLPTVIEWSNGPARYAVPDPWRPEEVKLAEHMAGHPVDPDTEPPERPTPSERCTEWSRQRFRGIGGAIAAETCLYTTTPDEDFVLQRVGPVVVGSPCSGHGFKFAPLIGETLARLATGEAPAFPLQRFAWPRGSSPVR